MDSTAKRPIKKRNGSRHDKTGCLTCRYRRKKCTDNRFPVCGTCSRLQLKCVRAETHDIVPDSYAIEKSRATEATVTPPTQHLVFTGMSLSGVAKDCVDSSQKRRAMGYYISTLTTYLAVSQDYNSFLTAFVPMAMESVAMFDILLAFALGHLSLTDETYRLTALKTRSAAIQSLALAISTPSNANYETNAAASLAFIIEDAAIGDCKAWYTHLKGAHNIIQSSSIYLGGQLHKGPEAFRHSAEGRWIIRNYAYHDIIGSITSRKPPLLRGNYLDGFTDVVDSCIGVAAGLLSIIARIALIDEKTTAEEKCADNDAQKQSFPVQYLEIERELVDWQCQFQVSNELQALAYAYRSASLIVLYRLAGRHIEVHHAHAERSGIWRSKEDAVATIKANIQKQVTETLGHVSDVPIGSPPEGALLFPVFMAGGEATKEEDIDAIRSRLMLMAEKRRFRNLTRAREVLEALWDLRRRKPDGEGDWTKVLDATGESLLLT